MKIRIKGIYFDRYEDAPFSGALLSSIQCSNNCKNCFNQHIKKLPTIEYEIDDLIQKLKENPFCDGIILSGLEWTEQKEELECVVINGLANELEIILYTGMDEEEFKDTFPNIYDKPIYIKFGQYDESMSSSKHYSYGVKLASTNQYIRRNY